jgi:uncharacterized protein YndB with AHSA1/START domain
MLEKSASEAKVASQTSMQLNGDREIVIARTFRGPARIVFEAWTKPEFVRRWWAPKSLGCEITGCEGDVRVGGSYRYVTKVRDNEFAFSGTYSEITPYTRLVYTQIFEPMAEAGAVIVTVTFAERDGQTRLVAHELYPSKEAREGALASGMEHGMRETMDLLDELVVSLADNRPA